MSKKHVIRDAEDVSQLKPHEHVYQRPQMWIGSIEPEIQRVTLCSRNEDGNLEFRKNQKLLTSDGYEHIHKELIINSRDAIIEGRDLGSTDCDIWIKITKNRFTIRNGGNVLPVKKKMSQDGMKSSGSGDHLFSDV